MASGDEDGGPAFPGYSAVKTGMTLRDWFAGQALAGIASQWFTDDDQTWEDIAVDAYGQADAMLAQRKDARK